MGSVVVCQKHFNGNSPYWICLVKYGQWICGTFDPHIISPFWNPSPNEAQSTILSQAHVPYTCCLQIVSNGHDSIGMFVIMAGGPLGEIMVSFNWNLMSGYLFELVSSNTMLFIPAPFNHISISMGQFTSSSGQSNFQMICCKAPSVTNVSLKATCRKTRMRKHP